MPKFLSSVSEPSISMAFPIALWERLCFRRTCKGPSGWGARLLCTNKGACCSTLFLAALVIAALVSSASAQMRGASNQILIGTEWLLVDLGGSRAIDNAKATLAFPKPGEITGMGSCNHFFGSIKVIGQRIFVSKLGATMMQCADAVSDQEQRYLTALETADRIARHGHHLFVYSKALKETLRFFKLQK